MSSQWRIIDCSKLEGRIYSERGAIRVAPLAGIETLVPLEDVAVLLLGDTVLLSGGALHKLVKNDISVLICDWRGVPDGGAYSWTEHGRVCARQRAQVSMTVPRQKNAWAKIIRAKILGQALTLELLRRENASELRSMARIVRSGDPNNLEARAAHLYWKSLWGSEGFHRTPGQNDSGDSERNAHLDYAYTVLRGHGIRAVLAAGLSPAIGLFHHGRSNNFALVDDLIEPFRPVIDFWVAQLDFDASMKDRETRSFLVAAASKPFMANGLTIPSALEDLAQHFGQYCEGEHATLPVLTWDGTV